MQWPLCSHFYLLIKDCRTFRLSSQLFLSSFCSDDKEPETNISRKELLFLPGFLGNCCCYLVTALVQHGVLQWSQLFIVQEKHQSVLTGTHVLLSVMKEFMFSLYELHSSIHCRILFLNLHADYEVGFVPFGFSIVPVFATFMPT